MTSLSANSWRTILRRTIARHTTSLCTKVLIGTAALAFVAGPAAAQSTIRIAYVDPLSGGMASTGEAGLKTFQFLAEEINAKGGVLGQEIEIIGYDNKLNAQESLVQVQKAIDAGIRIITQGNGSAFAAAIEDFVGKYNDRNPGKEVVYFNYAAVDPVLTNEKCNYWHFRWDANSDIKMEALTNYMKPRQSIKKLYLINQDYSFGQAVRAEAKKMLAKKRPDIQIVGDEVHALAKITDFSPYVAKIKASGADSVITGNWGADFALLLKAAADAGLQVDWYTYYAGGIGGPTAIKQANAADRVFAIQEGVANDPYRPAQDFEKAFRAKEGITLLYPRVVNQMRMLVTAINEAKSAEPGKIAQKLEGAKTTVYDGGDGFMRADDHQFFQPMYIAQFGPLGPDQPFDEEKTGWGWKNAAKIDTPDTILPTTCKMNRPSM
jgi:branched-chain amino acid transport system substrate-binding protein